MKPRYLTPLILIISSLFAEVDVTYTSDFEAPEGFADETPLAGNWTTTDNSVVITDEAAQSGTQSVRIPPADPENRLSFRFTSPANTILFADYYMQLTVSVLPEVNSFDVPATTALIAVQSSDWGSGDWVFLNGDGSGDGVWFVAGDAVALDEAGRTGWHRFTLRLDLASGLWDVYIDGSLLAINLGFAEALTVGSGAINIYGSRGGVAYLDNFSLAASNPLFNDADLDGIEDTFEAANGLNDSVDDRDRDPDADGLSNIQEYFFGTDPATFDADEGMLSKVLFNRTNWYIDSVNGDDVSGVGSAAAPFRSLSAVLSLNDRTPGYVGAGDTVYLAAGAYALSQTNIDIAGLHIEGTLGNDNVPVTQVGNIKVTADHVTLENLNFHNSALTLQSTTGTTVNNNIFSGSVDTSLSLIGASENVVRHNRFASAIYQSIYIYWDSATQKPSNDNLFLNNYFTHRPAEATRQIIHCNWTAADASSISARNRFIRCAFEETARGLLEKVIYDGSTWWMVVDHQYSVRFEDCYFKRADRAAPFSEFVILAGNPDFKWRWDESTNDAWVSSNDEYAITGDYKGWNHAPRIQFVDSNANGLAIETSHSAGLLSNGNSAPEITSAAITSVDVGGVYRYTVTVSDMDSSDIVTLSVAQLPEWLSFDGTTLSGTPTAAEIGAHTVELIATDSSGATATQTFTLTVNAVSDDTAAIDFDYVSILFDQDYAYSYTGSVGGTVIGLGSDYADYSIRVYSKTDADYLIGTVDIDSDGAWSLNSAGVGQKIARLYPKADTDTALAEAYGEGETAAGNYVNQNDAPGLDYIAGPIELEENVGEQTLELTGIHDGDHGTQTITISAVSDNPGLIANPVVSYDPTNSPETATLSYTPRNGVTGAASITLTLQDDGGTEVVGGIVGWQRLAGKNTKTISFQVVVGSGEDDTATATLTDITDRTDWYVDPANGNDVTGIGSEAEPFGSLAIVLALNTDYPDFVNADDTVHLVAGDYGLESTEIAIAGLIIEGTLDVEGKPLSKIGNLTITATDVTLKNLNFHNTQLMLQGATGAEITNNMFSGSVSTSLSLTGASNNVISYNRFASAIHQCVYIYWDSSTGQTSDDNLFLSNYFTHHPSEATNQIIYCNWTSANEDSISARNRFIDCAFEETISGQLNKVIFDEGSWWMVVDHEYSLRFEDCFFKRADRLTSFSQFDIIKVTDEPDFEWRWDELLNDEWVAPDYEQAITGDRNNWGHPPRIQFVDSDGNESVLEQEHDAGLLVPGVDNYAPVVENPIARMTVGKDAVPNAINLYNIFEDVETADPDLTFSIINTNSALISSKIADGTLTLGYTNTSGTATITVIASDDDPENPRSVSDVFLVVIRIDTDSDGLEDEFEQAIIDSDPNDRITSLEDITLSSDFDNDGLSIHEELLTGTSDLLADTDGDKINDAVELENGLNPIVNLDSDSDGLPDDWENHYLDSLQYDSSHIIFDGGYSLEGAYTLDADPTEDGRRAARYSFFVKQKTGSHRKRGRNFSSLVQVPGYDLLPDPPKYYLKRTIQWKLTIDGEQCAYYGLENSEGSYTAVMDPFSGESSLTGDRPRSGIRYGSLSRIVSPTYGEFYNEGIFLYDYGCRTIVEGSFKLSHEYTTAMLVNDVKFLSNFKQNDFVNSSLKPRGELRLSDDESSVYYESSQFKFRWEENHQYLKKHPVKSHIFFVPGDSDFNKFEIVGNPIIWDGSGNESPVFEIDPNNLKPGANGTFVLLEIDLEINDENGNVQIATEENPANIPVNGDFDEEKQVNGRYVRDYEDAEINFTDDSTDLKTDDLRNCEIKISRINGELWQNTTLKIRKKAGMIDPETGEEETGEIRIHAIDANKNWVEVPLNTDLAPDFYAPTGQYANYNSWWIEGIKDGPVTIEMEVVVNDGTPITIEKKAKVCTEKTKAEWQQELQDEMELLSGVDMNQFNPSNGFSINRSYLQAVYFYYEELFMRDLDYIWPGMAKMAGAPVYGGLSDAEYGDSVFSIPIVIAMLGLGSDVKEVNLTNLSTIQTTLIEVNKAIYEDLAWQFKAYHTSGLCALEYVYKKADSDDGVIEIDVWRRFRAAEESDYLLVQDANRDLLLREQSLIVIPGWVTIANMSLLRGSSSNFIPAKEVFSILAKNPIPGGEDFRTVVPGGDITDFTDRWAWIDDFSQGMWKLWTDFSIIQQRSYVEIPLTTRAASFAWLPVQ